MVTEVHRGASAWQGKRGVGRPARRWGEGIFEMPGVCGRRGGLLVSALDPGSSGPGSGPGRGHCVVFLGKTLYSHGASLHPSVSMATGVMLGVTLRWTSIPSRGEYKYS